ncbi:MAG: Rne/Rng family ribonuclease [Dermatophilaceae bacterium]
MAPTDEQTADAPAAPRRIRKKTLQPDADGPATPPRKRAATRKRAQPQQDQATVQPDETALDLVVTEALGLDQPDPPDVADFAPAGGQREGNPEGETEGGSEGGSEGQDRAADRQTEAVDRDDAGQELADESDESDESDEEPPGQVTSFGLVFQAPEPLVVSPRERRTAQAPVPDAAPELAGEDAGEDGIPEDAGQAADASDEEEDEEAEPVKGAPTAGRRRRRRGGKGRKSRSEQGAAAGAQAEGAEHDEPPGGDRDAEEEAGGDGVTPRRRTRRRRRSGSSVEGEDGPGVVTKVREPRGERDEVVGLKGSTRLEAKKQRRREGREAGRRRTIITEAEFLARRESVERVMLVRRVGDRTQIAVLEDGVLVEHYVSRDSNISMAGNIYLGKVQNVLPSMEAAFVDIGKGRNAVLYAGEVNWDAAGLESGTPKRIENALESGQSVLVQVTKDPIGQKGARLTSQISLPGRYLVYVPDSGMTGISRKLPDTERSRLKRILREVVPESAGVIVRTAAEGASEADLRADVERLAATWEQIRAQAGAAGSARKGKGGPPVLLHGEADLTVRVIRDIFNEDFAQLVVAGQDAWEEVSRYVHTVAPDLGERVSRWTDEQDLFGYHRVDEQIAKAMNRKVWLPSGGSLVIDRTEAMTVVDVNTGKFIGSGGNLEETVTRNNIEAAEEIVRQLRLRDIGGIIVIDFIDMVLESNRDLVVRRLLECLGRDRTKHQVAEVTSLGLVQMTRKRVGSGLIEVFSETCEHCNGRGYLIHNEPVDRAPEAVEPVAASPGRGRRGRPAPVDAPPTPPPGGPTPAQIAAAAHAAAIKGTHSDLPATLHGEGVGGGEAVEAQETAEAQGTAEATGTPGVRESVEAGEVPGADGPTEAGEPWGAAIEPTEPTQPAEPAEPVEPVEPVQDAASEPSDVWDDATATGMAWQAASGDSGGGQSAGNGANGPSEPRRRRHGRVVAPAGPPPSPE